MDKKVNMRSFLIITFNVFCLVSLTLGYGSIPIELKGNTLSLEEYHKLELCQSKWCLRDANRISEDMSYNNSENPCDDFAEFTCGTFHKDRAYNERYESVGFDETYKKQVDEQRDRMLKVPIKGDDVKAVKLAKNFYKRCLNSSYIEKQSRQEVLEYIASFGKFPFQDANWTETDLNFPKLETETKLEYFIDFEITHCPSPKNESSNVLCLNFKGVKNEYSWYRFLVVRSFYVQQDIIDMFETLSFSTESLWPIFSDIQAVADNVFKGNDFPDEPEFVATNSSYFVKIKDMESKFGKLPHADWIDVFKKQLPEWLQIEDTDEILISSDNELVRSLRAIKYVDKRLLAHVVLTNILSDYRPYYKVYPFGVDEYNTAIKTPERFEICNNLYDGLMPITAYSMFGRRYFSKEAKEALHSLMQLAVDDLKADAELDGLEAEPVSWHKAAMWAETFVQNKSIQIIAGYPNDMNEDSFLNKLYGNLNLNGTETLIKSTIAMHRYQRFVKLLDLSEEDLLTFDIGTQAKDNVLGCVLHDLKYLYCPVTAVQYPIFHKDRSQFYNMATLLPEIYRALCQSPEFLGQFEVRQKGENFASRSYEKWVKLHGPEPNLPGFLLTNEEMFWLALVNKFCGKGKAGYIHGINNGISYKIVGQYFFKLWKPSDRFLETFNCTRNESMTPVSSP